MLVRNYGHLWERRFIHWGRGGKRGHLCGYRTPSDEGADFRDQIGIYVLFDRNQVPVYTGQAGAGEQRLLDRLRQHRKDHLWNRWEYFSWFGFRRVNAGGGLSDHDTPEKQFKASGADLLNEVEGALLVALEPKLNKQGPRWSEVEEFYQFVDEGIQETSIDSVQRSIEDLQKKIGRWDK